MAVKGKQSTKKSASTRSDKDNARWIIGIVIVTAGLILTLSVLSYYFHWKEDYAALTSHDENRTFSNSFGSVGAYIGDLLVHRSFGVFGILVPVMLMLFGVRVVRRRPLLFNHSTLSCTLVLLLGSLTLGLAFSKEAFPMFNSGWGGNFGIEVATYLGGGVEGTGKIGKAGTIILLVVCWILTGVFINRNFINTLNDAGNSVVGGGKALADKLQAGFAARMKRRAERRAAKEAERAARIAEEEARAAEAAAQDVEDGSEEPDLTHEQQEFESEFKELPADERYTGNDTGETEIFTPIYDTDTVDDMSSDTPAEQIHDESYNAGDDGTGDVETDESTATTDTDTDVAAGAEVNPDSDEELFIESDGPEDVAVPLKPRRSVSQVAVDSDFEEVDDEHPSDEHSRLKIVVQEHKAAQVDDTHIGTLYDPMKDLNDYRRPSADLLDEHSSDSQVTDEEIRSNKRQIEETLANFGIPIRQMKATVGPTVTLYEIVQEQGVKISKIQGLEDDIAQSLKALGIRIIAPMPGRGTIGIEVPNHNKEIVSMRSSILSKRFQQYEAELPVVIGRTIQNENFVFDLAKIPHLLVAGATGQGKSVGLNAIITSLLYRKHPSQLKFVLIDPKMVEFSLYSKLEKHFLARMQSEDESIITDPKKAVNTLNSLCIEMGNRLELCKKAGAKNIVEYNNKFLNRRLNPQHGHYYMPYIVVVIDEFADLIMMAKEVEAPVMRLAQKARAAGIHLIIATQRPDVKVITGGIKANFPSRIAFRVMSTVDSKTILDQPGANHLIGRGDMLFSKDGELTRIQCALVETDEVERIVEFIGKQSGYSSAYMLPDYEEPGAAGSDGGSDLGGGAIKYDALFAEIARDAVSGGQISTSYIQRNYEVGFNRAGRIMTQLERAGVVGPQIGAKPREIKFYDLPSLEAKLQELGLS